MRKPEILIVALALAAMAAKIYCALTTIGTTDILLFQRFGKVIVDRGLLSAYELPPFNHTPLVGTYVSLVFEWTFSKPLLFPFFIRLPGILADFGLALVFLWIRRRSGRPSWWALSLLAASPVSFMISGFHGNFDSVIPLLAAIAVAACIAEQPMVCGLFLGLACQVKIVPLLLAPAFFFFWLKRQKAVPFSSGFVAIILTGCALPLFTIPGLFLSRVLAYDSTWGWWGIPYLLSFSGAPSLDANPITDRSALEAVLTFVLKGVVVFAVIALAWRKRGGRADSLFSTLALSWTLLFVFAPGFGVQYLVWIGPFLIMHSERWFAVYVLAASVALFAFYTAICNGLPWNAGFHIVSTMPQWRPWLLLPWGTLVTLLIASSRWMYKLAELQECIASEAAPPTC